MLKRKLTVIAVAGIVFVFSLNGFSQQRLKAAKAKTNNTASKSVKKNRICPSPMCGGVVKQRNSPITPSHLVKNEQIKTRNRMARSFKVKQIKETPLRNLSARNSAQANKTPIKKEIKMTNKTTNYVRGL